MNILRVKISNLSDIERLEVQSTLHRSARGRVVIDLPSLNEPDSTYWTSRLERALFACGCAEGTLGSLIGVCAIVCWRILASRSEAHLQWSDFPLVILVFACGIALGKALGILRAKFILKKLKRRLAEIAQQNEFSKEDRYAN